MILEFLPSLGWFLFYALGSVLNYLHSQDQELHVVLTWIVLFLFLICDYICFRQSRLRFPGSFLRNCFNPKPLSNKFLTVSILGIVLVVLGLRFHMVGLNIVSALISEGNTYSITESRIALTRNPKYPALVFYLINWTYLFISPWAISLLASYRNNIARLTAIAVFLLTYITSLIAAERFPLVIFVSSCSCFAYVSLLKSEKIKKIAFFCCFIVSILLFVFLPRIIWRSIKLQ